jgi:hypothetical protein
VATSQKNILRFLDFTRARFFSSKKEEDIFLLGSALQVFGRSGGASLRQAGKNSFPPFFFARLLETPSGFFGRRRDYCYSQVYDILKT